MLSKKGIKFSTEQLIQKSTKQIYTTHKKLKLSNPSATQCIHEPTASALTWSLLEIQNLGPYHRHIKSESAISM